jgi:protocatechuate 3,4-dioxygenase beta subunit
LEANKIHFYKETAMRRRRGVIRGVVAVSQILLLAIILVLIHSGAGAHAQGSISITSTVDDSNGNPVQNVQVYATATGTNTVEYGPVTTASDGMYDLPVDAGTYDFYFVPPNGDGLGQIVDSNVAVTGNQTIDEQFSPAAYTVSGTVTDQNGNPLQAVEVSMGDSGATTDSNGQYSFLVPAGSYGSVEFSSAYGSASVNVPQDVTANTTLNFTLPLATLDVTAEDSSGNPENNAGVFFGNASGTTTITVNGTSYSGNASNTPFGDTTGDAGDGEVSELLLEGLTYPTGTINVQFTDGTSASYGSAVTLSSDNTTLIFAQGQTPVVAASNPTNLSASSPTNQYPVLAWTGVSGATYYNIYRDGNLIDEIGGSNTSYTDNSLTSNGTYTYAVTAVNSSGESPQSNSVSVIYNTTPPTVTITGVVAGETYPANEVPTPVCNTSSNDIAGIATDATLSTLVSGNSYTATCSGATDNAGNLAAPVSVTYTVLPANYTLVNFVDSNGNPLSDAKVTIENSESQITTLSTDSFGNAFLNTAPGSYKVTVWYANGYESEEVTVTANGPNNISFTTIPLTVTINDSNASDLANASVAQAGNTGDFGSKVPVNGNGQVTFQVLPGTNYFTAYDANGYEEQSLDVSASNNTVTFNTYTVTVTVDNESGNPLTTATVEQAGNTGDYGSKQAVNSQGHITFNVLPGTNYFTAWNGSQYTKETLDVTANTSTTIAVE